MQEKPRTKKKLGKVVVAMSGGVDSSVTAALLKTEGYEVVGCFMRLGSEDSVEAADGYDNMACKPHAASEKRGTSDEEAGIRSHKHGCCSVNDAADARLVAAMLDIPFYVLNFKKDFGRIINYFVDEYNAGRTPNPCVRCNDWLKFGKLHDYARSIDADYVASGHYARISRLRLSNGSMQTRLLRGLDHRKDQSYVLFGTTRDRLERMLLPIGEFEKPRVRELAREFNLPVFDKPDSQEICFVPDNDYARLVERRSPDQVSEGRIIDNRGEAVGTHPGHQHFTIGQRRGVGVALGYPIYVVDKDPRANTITVGSKDALLASGCTASQTNWLIDDPSRDSCPPPPGRGWGRESWRPCMVKVRYNSQPTPAKVRVTGDDTLEVRFDEPLSAVTPGQAVVCYGGHDGEQVLGGGWIDKVFRAQATSEGRI